VETGGALGVAIAEDSVSLIYLLVRARRLAGSSGFWILVTTSVSGGYFGLIE
jgi:hypothetical protein